MILLLINGCTHVTKLNKILRADRGSYSICNVNSKYFPFRHTLVSLQAKLGLDKAVKNLYE